MKMAIDLMKKAIDLMKMAIDLMKMAINAPVELLGIGDALDEEGVIAAMAKLHRYADERGACDALGAGEK